MTIGSFAKLSGISTDTIRYYEKINLIRRIDRDKGGRRKFQSKDIAWIQFIKRLKDTGMPLAEILRYADLREKGDSTIEARYHLLKHHALVLNDQIALYQNNLSKLNDKISFYKKQLNHKKSS